MNFSMPILYPYAQEERKDFLQKGHVMPNLRLLFQALHGLLVQPLGMHARAGELIAQALGEGFGFIGLGIRRGQPGCEKQGANDDQQGVNNRLQHEDLLFN
jgi:hypothetical protein